MSDLDDAIFPDGVTWRDRLGLLAVLIGAVTVVTVAMIVAGAL